MTRRLTRFLLLASLLGAHLPAAVAASEEPVVVRGDQVEYLDVGHKVIASGHVVATYKETKLSCDQATIYMETKDAYLKGNVQLVQTGGLLKGQEVLYNFATRKGVVLEAQGEAGPWRSVGDRAEKIAATAFTHRDGYFTSCDFEQPHTRLKAKEIQVFLDDKIILKNAVTYVGNVPVFYLPSYTYPLDDKRPRVTLIPGRDKVSGLFLLTSWRAYVNEDLQGQIHLDYRERLDLASGFDVKYALPVGGNGIVRAYYTNQRQLHRKHAWSKYTHPEKDKPTTEQERFRVQLRHRWDVDPQTHATVEYHEAKDPAVIKDFFLREFERDGSPQSYFQVIRGTPWYGLTFLVTKRVNRFDNVTQNLPQVVLDLRPIYLPWLPVIGQRRNTVEGFLDESSAKAKAVAPSGPPSASSQAGWFYRSSYQFDRTNQSGLAVGTSSEGLSHEGTVQELFYQVRLFHWLNARPFGQFLHDGFSRGANQNAPLFRQAGAAGFDLSTQLSRIYPITSNLLGIKIHQLRHVVTPTLAYRYKANPTYSSDRFLRSDGLAKANTWTPGVEQKLQTKRFEGGSQKAVELGRFLSSVTYDAEGPSGIGGRWNNVLLDLETRPYRWVILESDASINPRQFYGKPITLNADLVISPIPEDYVRGQEMGSGFDQNTGTHKELPWAVGLGYRYQREQSSQVTLETVFNLGPKWRVGIFEGFDAKRFITETSPTESRSVKKIYDFSEYEYRLRRDLHEWTVELVYNHRRNQGAAILLVFRLKALPDTPLEFQRNYNQPKAGRNFPKR